MDWLPAIVIAIVVVVVGMIVAIDRRQRARRASGTNPGSDIAGADFAGSHGHSATSGGWGDSGGGGDGGGSAGDGGGGGSD
jgi:hypothetical protein